MSSARRPSSASRALEALLLLTWCRLAQALQTHTDGINLPLAFAGAKGGPADFGEPSILNHAIHKYPSAPAPYETLGSSSAGGRKEISREIDPASAYSLVAQELSPSGLGMTHSHQIVRFVATLPSAPKLLAGGCLYLPSDASWRGFYGDVEHPYPPLFAEMVANSFYPGCSGTSLSGATIELCPDGKIQGSRGCFEAQRVSSRASVHIFKTNGHVGLPQKWISHITRHAPWDPPKNSSRGRRAHLDSCSNSLLLPAVPPQRRLRVPTKVVLCTTDKQRWTSDPRKLVEDQIAWTNLGYNGASPWNRMSFDPKRPPQVDMQMQFDLKEFLVQEDADCAQLSFQESKFASRYNTEPGEVFTIVLVGDDESGILGMSPFPMEVAETDPEFYAAISSRGVRGWANFSGDYADSLYDEGDTVTHEIGHTLGLFHTFEGGCTSTGDEVSDTMPEAFPHYACEMGFSCFSDDPVHNFMDYTPDFCMSGFTEFQKRRAWCIFERYRPKLFGNSLTTQ